LGGSNGDLAESIQQTADGGYVVAGITWSVDGNVMGGGFHGQIDYWIVKLDASGKLLWQKCLGGSQAEYAQDVQQTADKGYIVAGYTNSNNYNVRGNHGGLDFWAVKLREVNCTITAPDVVCAGSTGNAASTAESNATYFWTITNGNITSASNAQSISFAAGSQGTATLKVTVTAEGCMGECSKDISIAQGPECSWKSNAPVCDGTPVTVHGPRGDGLLPVELRR